MNTSNDNTTNSLSSTEQPKRTGIVLNRMYTGSYLSSNLGHEVINMFQADNGKHYLYLNARGNFDKKTGEKISDMLLVRYVGENRLEILAWASGLTPAPGADKSYKKFEPQSEIRKSQGYIISREERKTLEVGDFPKDTFNTWDDEIQNGDISYGRANLIKIFDGSEQQNIYITYRAGIFRTPAKGKRLFLEFVNDADFYNPANAETGQSKDDTSVFYFSGYLLGKTTLHQFILDNDPYKIDKKAWDSLTKELDKIGPSYNLDEKHPKYLKLKALLSILSEEGEMDYDALKLNLEDKINGRRQDSCNKLYSWLEKCEWVTWKEEEKRVSEKDLEDHKPREKSLFDIVPKLQRDENCFSDALKFFIDKDKDEWYQVLAKLCTDDNIGPICSIEREKDATINTDKDKTKGGRIDLLIRTQNAYMVIENKIKSDINSNKQGENQLDRYRAYVNYRIIGDYIDAFGDNEDIKEIKVKEYDVIKASNWEKCTNEWKGKMEENLKCIYQKSGENWNYIKAYFFILAPDYNLPGEEERKGYLPLYYSTLVGEVKEDIMKEFPYLQGVAELMNEYHEKHCKENLWTAFYDAMKRHSYDYENDSLYEDMKNTFFTRIQKCPKIDENA